MQNYTLPDNASTAAPTNGTASAGGNSAVNVLQQAEQLGAKSIVLYSSSEQVRSEFFSVAMTQHSLTQTAALRSPACSTTRCSAAA